MNAATIEYLNENIGEKVAAKFIAGNSAEAVEALVATLRDADERTATANSLRAIGGLHGHLAALLFSRFAASEELAVEVAARIPADTAKVCVILHTTGPTWSAYYIDADGAEFSEKRHYAERTFFHVCKPAPDKMIEIRLLNRFGKVEDYVFAA
jgi:hypothetical protein